MTGGHAFTINLAEEFPLLECPPIVEAVIHWQARTEKKLDSQVLEQELRKRLPDYPKVQAQQELFLKSAIGEQGGAHSHHAEWLGYRIESEDGRNIAQFTRKGFVFSRVKPYQDWDHFATEAKRLWQIYVELAKPLDINRLGVRFINRIVPVALSKLEEVLTLPPKSPSMLSIPVVDFLHRSQFEAPGHPYRVNVIQTSQPPVPPENLPGLIVDIDVFTTTTTELNDIAIDDRLSEMRWLKNKTFYALLTEEMIKRLREAKS